MCKGSWVYRLSLRNQSANAGIDKQSTGVRPEKVPEFRSSRARWFKYTHTLQIRHSAPSHTRNYRNIYFNTDGQRPHFKSGSRKHVIPPIHYSTRLLWEETSSYLFSLFFLRATSNGFHDQTIFKRKMLDRPFKTRLVCHSNYFILFSSLLSALIWDINCVRHFAIAIRYLLKSCWRFATVATTRKWWDWNLVMNPCCAWSKSIRPYREFRLLNRSPNVRYSIQTAARYWRIEINKLFT